MKVEQQTGEVHHPTHPKRVKTGGRVLGTPNRLTNQIRVKMGEILIGELSNLPNLLDGASPNCRIALILKIANLLVPPNADWDSLDSIPDWKKFLIIEQPSTNENENPND
jgi:hypothetical protein